MSVCIGDLCTLLAVGEAMLEVGEAIPKNSSDEIEQRKRLYNVSIRQHTLAYVSIRQRMRAYASIRQRTYICSEEIEQQVCVCRGTLVA